MSDLDDVERRGDAVTDEDAALRSLGVEPTLKRALGTFTSTCLAIASEGPTASVLLVGGLAVATAGGAAVWVVLIVGLFQFVTALLWAELSSAYPIEGGLYQWGERVGGRYVGWLTGMCYLVFLVLALGPVGIVMTAILGGVSSSITDTRAHELLIGSGVIVGSAALLGARLKTLALVNAVGVIAELVVLVGAGVLLIANAENGISALWATGSHAFDLDYLTGPFVLTAIFLVPALGGFELAGVFAEEAVDARRTAPRAILRACAGGVLAVTLFLVGAVLAGPKEADPATFIPQALESAIGGTGAKVFLVAAAIALTSTVMAALAGISRLVFGMARDGVLPGSSVLRRQARSGEPLFAIALVTVLCVLPQFLPSLEVIVAATAGMVAFTYLTVVVSLLVRRLRGWSRPTATFNLGRWGWVASVVSTAWLTFVVVEDLIPRDLTNPDLGPLPVLWEILGGTLLLATAWWWLVLRRRPAREPGPDAAR